LLLNSGPFDLGYRIFVSYMRFRITRKTILGLVAFLFTSYSVAAQPNKVLRGRVVEQASEEPLVGAAVFLVGEKRGALTDTDGWFSIVALQDTGFLRINFAGYTPKYYRIENWNNRSFVAKLEPANREEVVITAEKSVQDKVAANQMSVENLSIKEAKLLPAIFGEVDILKTLQLKPGVQSGGEGFSGLYVRGGGPDQNLMLLDGATIYNPNHLFGFFSVFNSDAVSGVDLYKGAFPAYYSGRLSSVVDIKARDGDNSKWSTTGGIGLISSRLAVEGPIKKDKLTFLLSGRRTYFDIFTRYYNKTQEGKIDYQPIPDYYFQDLNLKLSWKVTPKDKITLTGYWGRDVFEFTRNQFTVLFEWGNTMANVRWQREINPDLALNSSLIVTDYHYKISNKFSGFNFGLTSGVTDVTAKSDLTWTPSRSNSWRTGIQFTQHFFDIGRASASSADGSFTFQSGTSPNARSGSAFILNERDLNEKWQINTGIALTGFNQTNQFFGGIEPRLSVRYKLNDRVSFKANYTRMYQYLHLASNSGASLPTDLWYPSNNVVKPQISDQVAASYSISLWDDNFFFSNEYYYKNMQRQIDLKDGASFFVNNKLDTVFVFGRGWAYGTEFYLEKKKGRLTGWIGYTLSYTWRRFADINFGEAFHPRYDKRHDISVVLMYKLSPRLNFSTTWVYGSGNAISLPEGRYFFQDLGGTADPAALFTVVPLVRNRNSFRMEPYHRWDMGLVYKLKRKKGEADLTFSIYNAYSRMNPFFIYFETVTENADGTGRILGFKAKQVSLFPVIPSVTYNFKF